MKARWIVVPFALITIFATAQPPKTPLTYTPPRTQAPPEEEKGGFDINRMFVGGSIGLGLGFGSYNSTWSIGGFPQVGYSFTDWLDAGIIFNANYYSEKYNVGQGDEKFTSFNYGTGAFVRGFPLHSFFIQLQPEINWIAYKQSSPYYSTIKATVNAPSLLVGVGFGQRVVGQTGFFTTIMIDVANDPNSPYRTNGNTVLPILRGGFYVYLHSKKKKNYENYQ